MTPDPAKHRLPDLRGGVIVGQHRRVKLSICRFAFGMTEHPAVGSWLARTCHDFIAGPRCGGLDEFPIDRAPVYAARNFAVKRALAIGADYLVMVDATDTIPDIRPDAPPFVESALAYAAVTGPCWVSAPVPMANNCVNVHRETADDAGKHLELLPLPEVTGRAGFERVPATGAGLVLVDLRVFDNLSPPWFGFVYADDTFSEVAAGEDVTFTARLTDADIPVAVAWDCWAGHRKALTLSRPALPPGGG